MDPYFVDNREEGKTLIHKCQLVMLRLLKYLDYYCRRHDVKYFLVGGSLLGAVRHNGFIPWDDDLDVGMTRENYNKFLKVVVPELPKDIFFQDSNTDPAYPKYSFVDAKLRDKYSRYTTGKYKYHDGLQIDIFVFQKGYLPNTRMIILQNIFLRIFKLDREKAIEIFRKILPFDLVYSSNYLHKLGQYNSSSFYLRDEDISELVEWPFEDMKVYIPVRWKECLQRQYGDFMQLPPEDKRVTHHEVMPDPFSPCDHSEILHWNKREIK